MLHNDVIIINPGIPCSDFEGFPVINVNRLGSRDINARLASSFYTLLEKAKALSPALSSLPYLLYLKRYVLTLAQKIRDMADDCIYHGVGQFASYALRLAEKNYIASCVAICPAIFRYDLSSEKVPSTLMNKIVDAYRRYDVVGFSSANIVVVDGLNLVEYAKRLGAKNVRFLPWPIKQLQLFQETSKQKAIEALAIEDDLPIVSFAGRLDERKGLGILLDAIAYLKAMNVEVRLIVAGFGPFEYVYEARARRYGIPYSFLGYREDLWNIFNASDIIALPFMIPDSSLALIEALSSHAPVVTTTTELQVFPSMEQFLCVPPGDARALACSIKKLLSNNKLREQIKANAKQYVDKYHTMERFISELSEIYASVRHY